MTEQNQEDNRIENEYNGYSLFTEIENKTLQAFNRCAVMFNIMEHNGMAMAEDYALQISEEDRSIMFAMFVYIKERGLERTKSEMMTTGLVFRTKEEAAVEESKNATIN